MSDLIKATDNSKAFLGRGWRFPVTFNKSHKGVALSQYEEDIRESLNILLSTAKGERVMRPDYGTNVRDLLFKPLDVSMGTLVGEEIKKAILLHEPRVFVDSVNVVQEELYGFLEVKIEYTIIATNTRSNMVFPFYLNEGTNIKQ